MKRIFSKKKIQKDEKISKKKKRFQKKFKKKYFRKIKNKKKNKKKNLPRALGLQVISIHFQKKKNLWTRGIGFPSNHFPKTFFFFQKLQNFFKILLLMRIQEDPFNKTFPKS